MKFLQLALLASVVASTVASAATVDVSFTANVSDALGTSSNTGYSDGSAITGGFLIDTVTEAVSGMYLGTYAAPSASLPATTNSATLTSTDALYIQGTNAGVNGATRNTSISIDLSSLLSGPGYSGSAPAAFLLQSPSTLAQLIDFGGATSAAAGGFPSTVTYYDGAANGSDITEVDAYVTGLSVATPVPLPPAAWLLGSGLIGLCGLKRRRVAHSPVLRAQ